MREKLLFLKFYFLTIIKNTRAEITLPSIDESKEEICLPKELLNSFAGFLVSEIKEFYQSEKGKSYFEAWLKKHPEYA